LQRWKPDKIKRTCGRMGRDGALKKNNDIFIKPYSVRTGLCEYQQTTRSPSKRDKNVKMGRIWSSYVKFG